MTVFLFSSNHSPFPSSLSTFQPNTHSRASLSHAMHLLFVCFSYFFFLFLFCLFHDSFISLFSFPHTMELKPRALISPTVGEKNEHALVCPRCECVIAGAKVGVLVNEQVFLLFFYSFFFLNERQEDLTLTKRCLYQLKIFFFFSSFFLLD